MQKIREIKHEKLIDIAKEPALSKSTISKVINWYPHIFDEVRDKVNSFGTKARHM